MSKLASEIIHILSFERIRFNISFAGNLKANHFKSLISMLYVDTYFTSSPKQLNNSLNEVIRSFSGNASNHFNIIEFWKLFVILSRLLKKSSFKSPLILSSFINEPTIIKSNSFPIRLF